MSPQAPQSIARYQIVRALGEGGMGSVYLAKDPAIDRFVAIKLLRSGFDDESARERFRREAKAVGQLHHINIVTIFDVGEHEGDPFIAMEYVEGQTVAQIVRSGTEIPLASALNWMDGLCAGLHYAHRRGIIHRDIKPANLVVDEENKVKILDFGIARGPTSGMTQVGMLMGTLNYMSPEQLSGKTLDHRSDIFAVGGVFYELLTGKQAFPGDINSGVLHKILMGEPDPLRQLNPTIAEDVAVIVDRCLAKDPAGRYTDLDAMRKELTRARARLEHAGTETTIRMRSAGDVQSARAGRTPGEKTRAELMRQRRERIHEHLARAREALAARELAVAAEACHQALILDPENAEAFDLQERIERLEQAQQWLAEAKNELARGGLTTASQLLDRVGNLDADLPDVASVREQIAGERQRLEEERRRLEEEQRRAQALQAALSRARTALGRDEIDHAQEALAEARGVDASHPEVPALAKAISERAAEIRRAQEQARAEAAVADAKRRFAAGEHRAAIAMLASYTPAHPLIAEARAALEFEHGEILRREAEERRRLEAKRREEEAKRREEEARKRREEEERRKAEEARRKAEEEQRRKAEARRQREEDERRQAEARKQREEDERRRLEAKRREDEARRRAEEAERQAAEERRAREQDAAAQDAAADEKTVVMLPPFEVQQAKAPPTVPTPKPPPAQAPAPPPPVSLANVAGGTASTMDVPVPVPFPGDIEPVSRWPASRGVLLGAIGAAAVLVIALVLWLTSGPGPAAAPASVLIDVRPWAAIESVTMASGQTVDVSCPATPCVVSLPPGEYHVRARNPAFQPFEFTVTVTGSEYQQVRQALPDFNAEEEARRILGGR